MEINEFSIYETLIRSNIKPEILKLLPCKPQQIIPFYDDGYILESPSGNMVLWVHRGQESGLACQIQILKICQQHGMTEFLYPLDLTDGRSYAQLNEVSLFYLTPWPEFRRIYFHSPEDLILVVRLLARFRQTIAENGFLFCLAERRTNNNLLEKYREIVSQLNAFAMLARHRLRPTIFDQLFLSYLPEGLAQADLALNKLENSGYLDLFSGLTPQNIIINKLIRHNLRIVPDGGAICLRLDDYRWDLPVIDLAILLIKSGRSSKWETNWFQTILKEYQKYFAISEAELDVIYAYLTFPWSFYRLASRYYYNRVEWPLRSFVEKMERLREDEVNREKFLKGFD